MNWKNRLTNYNFWVSIVSAIILVLQALKVNLDFVYVNEVFTAVLGLLVVLGIINDPTKGSKTQTKTEVDNSTNEKPAVQPQTDLEQKNLETSKNNAQNQEKTENLEENFENSENFSKDGNKSSQIENEKFQNENDEMLEKQNVQPTIDEQTNCIPHNDQDETVVQPVQDNLPPVEINTP